MVSMVHFVHGLWRSLVCRRLGQLERRAQDIGVADLVDQNQDEAGIQGRARLFVEAPMGLDQQSIGSIRIGKAVRHGFQLGHVGLSYARAKALSTARATASGSPVRQRAHR